MPSFESGGVDWWNVWGNMNSSLSIIERYG